MKKKSKLEDYTIEFYVNKDKTNTRMEVRVLSNLSEEDIENGFFSWSIRTKKHTVKSFCKYVESKDPVNCICKPYKD